MITIELNNTNPVVDGLGLAIKENPNSLAKVVTSFQEYCTCACEYEELVFGKAGGEFFENDITSLLFSKVLSGDTIVMKLYKNGELEDILNDNTYGIYYSTFTAQPLYVGYILEWEKVLTALGAGIYQIKIEKTLTGTLYESWTHKFCLKQYDQMFAHNTVRVETYQTGNILSSDFDYTDLVEGGWYASQRIRGKFWGKVPKLTVDNYLDKDYKLLQIQDKITNEWTFETELIPSDVSNLLIYDQMLANTILMSDYSIYSEEVNYRIPVYISDITEKKSFSRNKNSKFIIKFADKYQNILKHN